MFEIRELTGQTYVNAYAGKAHDEPPPAATSPQDPVSEQPVPRRTAAEVLRAAALEVEANSVEANVVGAAFVEAPVTRPSAAGDGYGASPCSDAGDQPALRQT